MNHATKTMISTIAIALSAAAGSASGDVLVDNGHITGFLAPSYAVQENAYEFQQFTVTDAAGWNITTLGLWSGLVQDDNGVGMTGQIIADLAGAPDMGTVIAEESWAMTGNVFTRTFDTQDYNIFLAQGTYWFAALPGGTVADAYVATIGAGTSGTPRWFMDPAVDSEPRPVSGTNPLALVINGSIAPAPGSAALLALGGIVGTRRRR